MGNDKIEAIQSILECYKILANNCKVFLTPDIIANMQNAYLKTINTIVEICRLDPNIYEDDLK